MTEQEIRTILRRQREYFATGATLSREFRAEQLGKLKASLQRHETELNDALQQDLGKSRMESYMCEIGLTLSELTPARADAGKESADIVIAVLGEELPVSVTLWHRADHESMELSGAIDAGSVDRCYCRREYRSGKTQCLCSGDGSSVKNDFGRMLPGGICGGDHRRQSRESGIATAAV